MASRANSRQPSLIFRRFNRTLYISSDNIWLHKEGENIVIKRDGKIAQRILAQQIQSIICFAYTSISGELMAHCFEQNVAISFVTPFGKFQARIEGAQKGNVFLRRAQHRQTLEPETALKVSQAMIGAKIKNQRQILMRGLRDHKPKLTETAVAELTEAQKQMQYQASKAMESQDLPELRGIEGIASKIYFSVFNYLIRNEDKKCQFQGRSKRPPMDLPNCILSFLYTILYHDCRAALECQGLDPQMGFLHQDKPGRSSLANDLMEEFRAPIVDRVCLSLINRKQISFTDVEEGEDGGLSFTEEGRRTVLDAYLKRKQEEIIYPPSDYVVTEKEPRTPLGAIPFLQAQMLARFMRGDEPGYPPFFSK